MNNDTTNSIQNTEIIVNIDKQLITYCTFCKMSLNFGMDENSMIHCQYCHNVWDGFAQCNCNLDYDYEYELKK